MHDLKIQNRDTYINSCHCLQRTHDKLKPHNSETAGNIHQEWSIVYFHILTHQPI